MKKIFTILILVIICSCSPQKIYQLITKTPKIEYHKPEYYRALNIYGKDALYLVNVIKTTYPKLYEKIPNFDNKAAEFVKKVSSLNDNKQFEIELKRFIAILKDGHTNFNMDFNKYDKEKFHFYLFKEKENWIIGNIDKKIDSSVIGSKIIAINGEPISKIEEKIRNFENGENDEWKFQQFLSHFSFPSYWEALELQNFQKKLNFKVESKEGKFNEFTLSASAKAESYKMQTEKQKFPYTFKQNNGFYSYFDKNKEFAYLQMNTSLDLVSIKDGIGNYTNFITKPFAMSFLKKEKKDAENFGKFINDFFVKVNSENIKNIILDLSYNTGGDERTGKQFIWYIARNKQITGFEETVKVSDYFKKQIKEDWKVYNKLYLEKYNKPLPSAELNISKEFYNKGYFDDITKKSSPYFLNSSIPIFVGNLYVITSPTTFSAGQVLATTISDNKLGTIIGRPTGNKPSTQTGASGFKLPYTKKIISLSYTYMERPDKNKNEENALYPNIEIYKTFDEFMKGEDMIMEYIIKKTKN